MFLHAETYIVSLCSEDECKIFSMLGYKISSQVMMSMTKKLKCMKVFKIWECTDNSIVLRVYTYYTLHMTLLIIFIFKPFLANSLPIIFPIIFIAPQNAFHNHRVSLSSHNNSQFLWGVCKFPSYLSGKSW